MLRGSLQLRGYDADRLVGIPALHLQVEAACGCIGVQRVAGIGCFESCADERDLGEQIGILPTGLVCANLVRRPAPARLQLFSGAEVAAYGKQLPRLTFDPLQNGFRLDRQIVRDREQILVSRSERERWCRQRREQKQCAQESQDDQAVG
jgi:hypothetical protein